MDKIFEQGKDLHVVSTYVYANGEDMKAYTDVECTKQFTVSELKEVFIKGALISISGVLFKPVCFDTNAIHFVMEGDNGPALVGLTGTEDEE